MPNTLQRSSSNQVWDAVGKVWGDGAGAQEDILSLWFLHPMKISSKIPSLEAPLLHIQVWDAKCLSSPRRDGFGGLAGREVFSPGVGLWCHKAQGGAWALVRKAQALGVFVTSHLERLNFSPDLSRVSSTPKGQSFHLYGLLSM